MRNDNKNIFKKSLRDYTTFFFIILLLLFILVTIIKMYLGSYTIKEFINDLFNSLLGAIIPLLLFNIVFEYLIKTHQDKVVSDAIAETLLMKEEILEQFSIENRKIFIKNCTESIIGKDEGEMLYSTLLSPYLNEKQKFKRNFKYYIFYSEIEKLLDFENVYHFESSKYVWVLEDLSFEISFISLNDEFLVGFSYNDQSLDDYFRDERFVFREILSLDDEEVAIISSMNYEEITKFIDDYLQFYMEINGSKAAIIGVEHDASGIVIRLRHNYLLSELDKQNYCKFKINFRMPQLNHKKEFVVIISEPTYGVDILFSNQTLNTTVRVVPFFDQEEIISNMPNHLTRIELSDWVLPTSGVVFVWDDNIKRDLVSDHRYNNSVNVV